MKPIHSSWYKLGCIYGGIGIALVNPIAGVATAAAFHQLYKSRRAAEDAERDNKRADDHRKFKKNFYARQNFSSYEEYLGSSLWREKRALVAKRAMGYCEHDLCNRAAEEVHHKRYPRIWGNEPIEWLVALCEEHHRAAHGHEEINIKR